MSIVNVEIYSIIVLLVLLVDYVFKFRRNFNIASILWLTIAVSTLTISISNIFFTLNDIYFIRLISIVVYLLSTLVSSLFIYVYVKYIYIKPDAKIEKEILYTVCSIIICIILTAIYLFIFRNEYIAHSFNRLFLNRIIILAIIPIIVILITYIVHCYKNEVKLNYKIVIMFLTTIFGLIFDLKNDSLYLVSATFTLTTLIIYINKHERLLNTDPLTGLANKRSLEAYLVNLKHEVNIAVYNIDVDKFKSINDNYGHLVGDSVLKDIASILRNSSRDRDLVIRNGGDEFLIVAEIRNKSDAKKIIDRVEKNITEYNETAEIKISISCGWGIYKSKSDYSSEEFAKFMKKIDEEMYIVKSKKYKIKKTK